MKAAMNNKARRQGGFTLVELMVTLAIIGILAGGAIELFDSLTKSQRVRSASFDLYSALSVARSEALKRGTTVTITPSSGTNWASGWNITYVNPTTSAVDTVKSQGPLTGTTVTTNPNPLANLSFARTGRPASTPRFQVEVTSTYRRCITLDLSGSPRTTTGACS